MLNRKNARLRYICITSTQFLTIRDQLNEHNCFHAWGAAAIALAVISVPLVAYTVYHKLYRDSEGTRYGPGDWVLQLLHLATVAWCIAALIWEVKANISFSLWFVVVVVITTCHHISIYKTCGGIVSTFSAWTCAWMFLLPQFWGIAVQSGDSEPRDSTDGVFFLGLFAFFAVNSFVALFPPGDRQYEQRRLPNLATKVISFENSTNVQTI